MVLAGPITFTPDDWSTIVVSGSVVVTVGVAITAAIVAAAIRWHAGPAAAATAAGRAVVVVGVVGVLVGVTGSWMIRTQAAADEARSTSTTAFVPAQRPDDHLPFSGDAVAAEQLRTEIDQALAPLAAADHVTTRAELEDALATIDDGGGPLHPVTADDPLGGVSFVIEAGGGCVEGSVVAGHVDVTMNGYIRDGGCVAAVGH